MTCEDCSRLKAEVERLSDLNDEYANDAELWRDLYQRECIEIAVVDENKAKKIADYINDDLRKRVAELKGFIGKECAPLDFFKEIKEERLTLIRALEKCHGAAVLPVQPTVKALWGRLIAVKDITTEALEGNDRKGRE